MTERLSLSLSSILVWRTPWTEEPGRLQSLGSQRVGHDWGANTFTSLSGCLHRPDLASGFTGSLLPSAGHHIATVSSGYKAVTKHCLGVPGGTSEEPACQRRRLKRLGFHPTVGKCPGGGKGNPLQCSCLENPKDIGADIGRLQSMGSQRVGRDWAAAV